MQNLEKLDSMVTIEPTKVLNFNSLLPVVVVVCYHHLQPIMHAHSCI